jgi:hypothetical protein
LDRFVRVDDGDRAGGRSGHIDVGRSGTGLDAPGSANVFAQLAVDLHGSDGVTETVDMVVQFALQAVDCTHAGVVFAEHGRRAQVAAVTDPALVDIYLDQVKAGDGPLVTAMTGLQTVLIRDTATDERWPA